MTFSRTLCLFRLFYDLVLGLSLDCLEKVEVATGPLFLDLFDMVVDSLIACLLESMDSSILSNESSLGVCSSEVVNLTLEHKFLVPVEDSVFRKRWPGDAIGDDISVKYI